MNERNLRHEEQRLAAALAIENKIDELAAENGMTVMSAVWNMNQGMQHGGPHQLDIGVEDYSARIYFTDNELLAYASGDGEEPVEERLRFIIAGICEVEVLPSYPAPEEAPQPHWLH